MERTTDDQEHHGASNLKSRYVEAFLVYGLLLALFLLVLVPAVRNSMNWRLVHDTPFLLYFSYVMDTFGMVPYRDFFDVNMLGSYLAYQSIGHFFGFDDSGVHRADVFLLLILVLFVVGMLWRMSLRAALAASILFIFTYLLEGPAMTLQRDYLALFPMSLGVACAIGLPFISPQWRALLAGIGFSAAAAVKPHMIIGLVPVINYLAEEEIGGLRNWRAYSIAVFWVAIQAALGAMLPVLGVVAYLVYFGAFGDFIDSAFHYVPLYAQMTGAHEILTPEARQDYVLSSFLKLKDKWELIALGFMGIGAGFANRQSGTAGGRITGLLSLLVLSYMVYPAITGQFWHYHYMPMMFWLCMCGGLVFAPAQNGMSWQQRFIPIIFFLIVCASLFKPHENFAPVFSKGDRSPKGGRVEKVASYLKENLQPGDTVQPLDWVGGGILQSMMYAGARPATKYFTYFCFFHHVDEPYIQELRENFLHDFKAANPRFVIEWLHQGKDWVRPGPRTSSTFPEFTSYLKLHYAKSISDNGFIIYERKHVEPEPLVSP